MNDEHPERGGRKSSSLYGRQVGKALRPHQRDLVATLLPRLSVDATRPILPKDLFSQPRRAVWLEIGFGAGEHLLANAARDPELGLIGCEPFLNGMARALAEIERTGLTNVRLHHGDAGSVVDALAPASLERIYLLYPDPWPKRRQRKRRFVSDEMLERLARVLAPGGLFCFATDIDDYCGWTLARLLRSRHFQWTAEGPQEWQTPWPDWSATRYESKAGREGRRPCYITAVRRPAP